MSLCQCRIQACQHQLPWDFESPTCSHPTSAYVLRHNIFYSLNKQADLTWKVEELREHLSFIHLGLLADVADRIVLPVAFVVAFIPTTISRYLKNQHPNGSPCCASHQKSLWRWLKTRLPVFWRVGHVTTSARNNTAANSEPKGDGQARLEHMYQDKRKDCLPEEKAEDKVQSWSSLEQVGQSNKECRKVICHRTLRCHVRLNAPQQKSKTYSSQDTKVSLF